MQWDECLNLDTILEEVLQQLIVPRLRGSILELCAAERSENPKHDVKETTTTLDPSFNILEEMENVLISRLPNHLQDALSFSTSKNKDIFSNAIKMLDSLFHTNTISAKSETVVTSPLEQLNGLPKIVRSVMEQVSKHFYLNN